MAESSVSVRVGLTAVLIMSLLAAAGPPANAANAAAGGTLDVGSEHSTQSEFAAGTLSNFSARSSVNGDYLGLSKTKLSYNPFEDEGSGSSNTVKRLVGDYDNSSLSSEIKVQPSSSFTLTELQPNVESVAGSDYGFTVDVYLTQEDTPDGDYSEGTQIVSGWDPDFQSGAQTIELDTSVTLSADTNYTVSFVTSSTDSDGSDDYLAVKYDDASSTWFRNTAFGASDAYADVTLLPEYGTDTPASYTSSNMSVTGAEQVAFNVTTASNVSATLTAEYYQGGSWTQANQTTVTGTGNHTLSLPDTASETWRTKIDVSGTDSNPNFRLHDESILFSNHAPSASNLKPPDGDKLDDRDVTFSVDVTDDEFGSAQGDTVTADLYVDGSKVGDNTTSSNSTVSVTHTVSSGGDHTYYWELTDSYGSTTTTSTQTVSAPSELRIYNESAPSQLVDNATVDILVYTNETGDAKVYERNTTDGTINMSGLPADQPFEVVAEAENYTSRRIFVPSLYETQSIYLLPDSEQTVTTIFELEDYTGRFPGENSVLLVQRGLNGTYRTVLGDFFGASGDFPGQLAYNTRHRLVIMNVKTGERRILGTHTPQTSSTKTVVVTPTGVTTFEQEPPAVLVDPQTRRLPAVSGTNLSVTLDPNDESIDSWSINASIVKNQSTTEVWNYSSTNPGTVGTGLNLAGEHNGTLHVNVTYVVDGATLTETVEISIDKVWQNDASFLATLTQLADLSAPGTRAEFTSFMAMLCTILVIGAVASVQSSGLHAGLAGVFVLTGFSLIGWVGYDVVFVAVVGLLGVTATQRGL